MTCEEAVAFIQSTRAFAVKSGLHRMRRLCALLGNPQQRLRFVHVAGTNGKGSVCSFLSAALTAAGYKTGLFISPYVVDFRERIQIGGAMIPKRELIACVQRVKPLIEQMIAEGEAPTTFEITTAVALYWYARQQCDLVVLEVGLGGRLDSTNVIERSLVSVITSIGLDHMQYLGDTVEQIAYEKCGILKPGGVLVSSDGQPEGALAVILEQAARTGNELILPNVASAEVLERSIEGTRFRYGGLELSLRMAGEHQLRNATAAFEALSVLRERRGLVIPDDAIAQGFSRVRFPARLEVLSRRPLVLLDGAHNLPGAQALCAALPLCRPRRLIAVLGMLGDKDTAGVVGQLGYCFHQIITTTIDNPRAAPAEELAELARPYCSAVTACPPVAEALRLALGRADENTAVVVCGSLYLASEARGYLLRALSTAPRPAGRR